MRRLDRYKRFKGLQFTVLTVAVILLLGGLAFFSREAPLPHENVVKAIDISRFVK